MFIDLCHPGAPDLDTLPLSSWYSTIFKSPQTNQLALKQASDAKISPIPTTYPCDPCPPTDLNSWPTYEDTPNILTNVWRYP